MIFICITIKKEKHEKGAFLLHTHIYYPFTTTYQNGNKTNLTPPWKDSNIIVPCNKFYFVHEGEIEIIVERTKYTVSKGEWLLLPAGTLHSYQLSASGYAQLYWMHFELTVNEQSFLHTLNEPMKVKANSPNKVVGYFNKIFKSCKANDFSSQLEVVTYTNHLIAYFIKHLPFQITIGNIDSIDEIVKYILNNYTEQISLSELAKMSNFSISRFTNLFKKRTGVTPIYYINLTRLEHAKYLLEQTAYPIKTIMEKVGFLDSSYFSKMFKNYYGVSPLQYRNVRQPLSKSRAFK